VGCSQNEARAVRGKIDLTRKALVHRDGLDSLKSKKRKGESNH